MKEVEWLHRLPGYELYREGMDAIHRGDFDSAAAQLLLMARKRLREAGIFIQEHPQGMPAHLRFYQILAATYPDAHYRYNASVQRLAKFCRALERRKQLMPPA